MMRAHVAQATKLLDHMQVTNQAPRHVGRLVGHDGGMLEVTGFSRPIGAGARIRAADGHAIRAEVVGFRGSRAVLVPLDQDAPLENGARVEPDSAANMVQVGDGLIGRVVDAMGQPLDRKGPILANGQWPLNGVRGNVLDKGRVLERFDLGVRAVNAL
jgi:Flagellar biosynthesis/type III secretory pathway ATPase